MSTKDETSKDREKDLVKPDHPPVVVEKKQEDLLDKVSDKIDSLRGQKK